MLCQATPLEEILPIEIEAAAAAAARQFDELAAPFADQLVLVGAGQLGRKTARGLRDLGLTPKAFADNNPALWNTTIDGVPVYSIPEAARRYKDSAAFVITLWSPGTTRSYCTVRDQLRESGCTRVAPFVALFWKYPAVFLPHLTWTQPQEWLTHRSEIEQVQNLWSDELSRDIYAAHWQWRLTADYDVLPQVHPGPQYFPADVVQRSDRESFVDCGAFNGDTLREFVAWTGGEFERVVAVEPDPANFRALNEVVAGLPPTQAQKIRTINAATGRAEGSVTFNATGNASAKSGDGDLRVQVVTLDALLAAERPTFIKMDIEGSEPDTLDGARETIARSRPTLAVCIYHELHHFWTIPLQMKRLCPDHSFFLRVHGEEGWDWLCYAIPPQ